jgi:hypothetical protein
LEDRLNDFITKKMEKFSDDMNNKLSDTLSFFKKQTEDLEENRRRNNETINKIIALIGMKNQNPMTMPMNMQNMQNMQNNMQLRPPMNPFIRPWMPNVGEMNNKFNNIPQNFPSLQMGGVNSVNIIPMKVKQPSPKKSRKNKADEYMFEAALMDKELNKIEPIIYVDPKGEQDYDSSESSGYISDEDDKNMIKNLNTKSYKGIPPDIVEKILRSKKKNKDKVKRDKSKKRSKKKNT